MRGRTYLLLGLSVILIAVVSEFPRVLAFLELASRELRYLWWLVLLLALAVWLIFFFWKKPDR
jgi:FtsH-binding integral membrane protein